MVTGFRTGPDLLRRKRGIALPLRSWRFGDGQRLVAARLLGVRIGLVGFVLWAAVLAGAALRTVTLFPALVDEWGRPSPWSWSWSWQLPAPSPTLGRLAGGQL